MKNLFVPYELALELKNKGFDDVCLSVYNFEDMKNIEFHLMIDGNNSYFENLKLKILSSPLYQQVIDWFREKHNISILIEIGTQEYSYILYDVKKDKKLSGLETLGFNGTYYEALNKAIEEALKLIF